MANFCKSEVTISIEDSIEEVVAANPKAKTVKVGYVGHWSSASQSVGFLKDQIVPVIEKHNVAFEIDNSACSATDNPYIVSEYLKKLDTHVSSKIKFKGNQVISTGGWDPLLPGKNNLWSKIDGNTLDVEFPLCKQFEESACWDIFQEGATGLCYDHKAEKFEYLECKENTRQVRRTTQNPNGKGTRTRTVDQTRYEWTRSRPNFKIDDLSQGATHTFLIGVEGSEMFDEGYTLASSYLTAEQIDTDVEKELARLNERLLEDESLQGYKAVVKLRQNDPPVQKYSVSDFNGVAGFYSFNRPTFDTRQEAQAFINSMNGDLRRIMLYQAQKRNSY